MDSKQDFKKQYENLDFQISNLQNEAHKYEMQIRNSKFTVKQSVETVKMMMGCIEAAGTLLNVKIALQDEEKKTKKIIPAGGGMISV